MGETGDPWRMPFCTGSMVPHRPSMQIAASLSDRKLAVHLIYSSGSFLEYFTVPHTFHVDSTWNGPNLTQT